MNSFAPNQINPVSGTPDVVKFIGLNGFSSTPYKSDGNNFAPRVGFARKAFGSERTVVRGGYGILDFPGVSFGASTFGVVNAAGPARQIEVGARLAF